MRPTLLSTAVLLTVLLVPDARAHSRLVESTPAAEATVHEAPREITLTFSAPVRLTALVIVRNGASEQKLAPLPAGSHTQFRVPAPELAPGKYVVSWSAVSGDGHVGSGTLQFQVAAHH